MAIWLGKELVNACKGIDPTASGLHNTIFNPVVFVVGYSGDFIPQTSTSITRNGTFVHAGLDRGVYDYLIQAFPCSIVVSIFTDDEGIMGFDIDKWIEQECQKWRGKIDVEHKCFILTEKNAFPLYHLFHSDNVRGLVQIIRNRKKNTITKQSPLAVLKRALFTRTPTTPAPVISEDCEDRHNPKDCTGHCKYFGFDYRCRRIDFCKFKTSTACNGNPTYCVYSPKANACRKKGELLLLEEARHKLNGRARTLRKKPFRKTKRRATIRMG